MPARSSGHEPEPGAADGPQNLAAQRIHAIRAHRSRPSARAGRCRRDAGPADRRSRERAGPPRPGRSGRSFSGVTCWKCGIREARHGDGRLVGDLQPELARDPCGRRPWSARPSASGRRTAWSVGRPGPGPVGRRTSSAFSPYAIASSPCAAATPASMRGEQLVLAVEAAIRAVGAVGRPVTLGGLDLDDLDTDLPGDLMGTPPLVGGQAGGDPEDGDHLVVAEHPGGEGQQHGGVDAAGEGDSESSDAGQVGRHVPGRLGQRSCWYGEICHVCHPNRRLVGVAGA